MELDHQPGHNHLLPGHCHSLHIWSPQTNSWGQSFGLVTKFSLPRFSTSPSPLSPPDGRLVQILLHRRQSPSSLPPPPLWRPIGRGTDQCHFDIWQMEGDLAYHRILWFMRLMSFSRWPHIFCKVSCAMCQWQQGNYISKTMVMFSELFTVTIGWRRQRPMSSFLHCSKEGCALPPPLP